MNMLSHENTTAKTVATVFTPEEVGHCMLPYIRDQILELVNESLLIAVL